MALTKTCGQNEMKISRLRRFERFLRQKNTKYAFAQVSQSHQTTSTALGWEPSITDGVGCPTSDSVLLYSKFEANQILKFKVQISSNQIFVHP